MKDKDNPLFLRRLKKDLRNFDRTSLFPPRQVNTKKYRLSDDEKRLYNAVTEYVEKYYRKAIDGEKETQHLCCRSFRDAWLTKENAMMAKAARFKALVT